MADYVSIARAALEAYRRKEAAARGDGNLAPAPEQGCDKSDISDQIPADTSRDAEARRLIRDTIDRLSAVYPSGSRLAQHPDLDGPTVAVDAACRSRKLAALRSALEWFESTATAIFARPDVPPPCGQCRGTAHWVGHDGMEHCERCEPPQQPDHVAYRFDFGPDPLADAILAGKAASPFRIDEAGGSRTERPESEEQQAPLPF